MVVVRFAHDVMLAVCMFFRMRDHFKLLCLHVYVTRPHPAPSVAQSVEVADCEHVVRALDFCMFCVVDLFVCCCAPPMEGGGLGGN